MSRVKKYPCGKCHGYRGRWQFTAIPEGDHYAVHDNAIWTACRSCGGTGKSSLQERAGELRETSIEIAELTCIFCGTKYPRQAHPHNCNFRDIEAWSEREKAKELAR